VEPDGIEGLLARTHVVVRPEHLRAASRYRVPVEVVATARGEPERVARALALAENRDLWALAGKMEKRVEILGRAARLDALDERSVVVVFPSGARVVVPWDGGPEEALDYFADYVLVDAVRDGKRWKAVGVKRVAASVDRGAAEEAARWMEERGYTPGWFHAAALALNYRPVFPEWFAYDLLARILPAVNHRVHAGLYTVPGTGKTHTAMVYRHALGWAYYPKPPTPASLVGDARTGRATGVRASGLWFDETDKWARAENREKLAQAIEILLTGLENCEWVREAGGEKAVRVSKCLPAVFAGNVGLMAASAVPREVLRGFVEPVGEGAADAFESRIAVVVVDVARDAARAAEWGVEGMAPRRGFVAGVFAVLRDRLAELGGPVERGERRRRHVENVRRAAAALGFSAASELAEQLTAGVRVTGEGVVEVAG